MRTHDLRRTLRTFLGEQGIPDEVADRVLNHTRPGVGNQHYNHAKMIPQVRSALDLWAAYIETACAMKDVAREDNEDCRVEQVATVAMPLPAA
jgi:hypothetical protein